MAKPFSPNEIERLQAMVAGPRRYGEVKAMARTLNRTQKSVARKLEKLKAARQ
jgi:predicted transcriptional regulator